MEPVLRELLEQFYRLTQIPVRWIAEEETPLQLGSSVFSETYDRDVREQLLQDGTAFCYQITQESLVYGFIGLRQETVHGYVIIGPVLMNIDRHQEIVRLSEAFHRPVSDALWEYVNGIPFWRLDEFFQTLSTLFATMRRKELVEESFLHHRFSKYIKQEEMIPNLIPYLDMNIDKDLGPDIMYFVEKGDVMELRRIFAEQSIMRMPTLPTYEGVTPLRTIQDMFLMTLALCEWTAVNSGVDRDMIESWAAGCVSQIERVRSFPEAEWSLQEMICFFAEQIAHVNRFADQSDLVRKAVTYVSGHLSEKITVRKMAGELGMNASYLSHQFKDQTGISLTEFINREKIEEAKTMLRRNRGTLLEISQQLGFSSQQYFQNVFRKTTGITPAQYQRDAKP
ncbi:MAG: AraC family transcriptional regulator [Firmicutes bacterium]|nr:AraC family transcriptional regulator [Bacillota bacterium]